MTAVTRSSHLVPPHMTPDAAAAAAAAVAASSRHPCVAAADDDDARAVLRQHTRRLAWPYRRHRLARTSPLHAKHF
jgi:hypothetical protein